MTVLNMKSRMSVAVRMYVVIGVAALMALGCPPKRGSAVRGPGTATPTDGGRRGAGGDQGDVTGVPRGGGGEYAIQEEPTPLENIYFEYDSAALTADAMGILQHHAMWIKDHPGPQVTIEGHCDERGTAEYNMALGEHRARAVYDYLTSLGVPGARLNTVSFGKERPVELTHNEAGWSKNRRAHFNVPG
jgi:peptidoglycan-associated lipoprotein